MSKGCSKERAYELLIDDATILLDASKLSIGRGYPEAAQDNIRKALDSIYAAGRIARRMLVKKKPDVQPIRAFCASVSGFGEVYVPARSSSKARYIVSKELKNAGYDGGFYLIRVARMPKYDEWAKTAPQKSVTLENMPRI